MGEGVGRRRRLWGDRQPHGPVGSSQDEGAVCPALCLAPPSTVSQQGWNCSACVLEPGAHVARVILIPNLKRLPRSSSAAAFPARPVGALAVPGACAGVELTSGQVAGAVCPRRSVASQPSLAAGSCPEFLTWSLCVAVTSVWLLRRICFISLSGEESPGASPEPQQGSGSGSG